MNSEIIIPDHLYKINIYKFNTPVYISISQSYDTIYDFLLTKNLTEKEISEYIRNIKKGKEVNGVTSLFIDYNLILIKLNYFDNAIRNISILMHEIIHASKRILYLYESRNERELENKEEAECYLAEYIFEEIMILIKPQIEYIQQQRNLNWFYEITHTFKNDFI